MIKSDYYSNLFDEIKFLDTSKFNGIIQDEEIFYVDLNTRNIEVPDAFKKELAIRGDHDAETVWFAVNQHFDGKDLAGYTWGVQVEDAKKNRKLLLLNPKPEQAGESQKEEFDKDALFLGWPITFDVTEYAGDISIALCCYTIEEDGESKTLKYRLGTNAVKLHIKDSLYINDETENIVPNPSRIEELIAKADELLGASGDLEVDWSSISSRPEIRIDDKVVLPGNGGDIINFSSDEFTNVNYNKLTNKPIYTINNKVLESNTPFSFSFDDLLNKPVYKLKDKSSNEYELINGEAFDVSILKFDYSQIEGTPELSYQNLSDKPKITVDGRELTIGEDVIEVSKITVETEIKDSSNPISGTALNAKFGTYDTKFAAQDAQILEHSESIQSLEDLIGGAENEESITTRIEKLEDVLGLGEGESEIPEGSLPELVQANTEAIAAIKDGETIDSFADVEIALKNAEISDTIKKEIAGEAAEVVFKDERYTVLTGKIGSIDTLDSIINSADTGLKPRVEVLESKIDLGDNENLKLQYEEAESTLYLYEGESLIKPDPSQEIEGNVISTTIVKGGGGGSTSVLNYNLIVKSSNPSTMYFADNDEVILNFRAELTDNDAPEGEDNKVPGLINFKITLTETTSNAKKVINFKDQANTDLPYDITKYLTVGTWTVAMVATYSEVIEGLDAPYVKTGRKNWTVTLVNLSLTINDFNYNDIKTKDVNINYTVKGDLNKTLYWKIGTDGEFQSKPNISVFEYSDNLFIPKQPHGSHTVEIYAKGTKTGSDVEIETKPHEILDIMFVDPESDVPVIRAVADGEAKRQQYGLIPINFTVYQKDKDMVDITLTVLSNGEVESISSRTVPTLIEQPWDYRPLTEGSKTLIIKCGDTEKVLTLEIEKFPYEINPVLTNLAFDFNPEGRTNQDADFDQFENNGVDWTVSKNFDWNNGGWKVDEEGAPYFCIKAGTYVDFNYNLFADANTLGTAARQGNGKEFKVVFKTTNVADAKATWLSCLADTEKNKPTGIQMDIQNGYVSSDLSTLTIPYSEEDIIEFDMNIVPFGSSNEKNIPMIMTYEDGTPVQPIVLTDETASFTQANPVPITIGSTDCDVHLYRMKAYSGFLSDKQILDNFIADARTGTEKSDRYLRNQIYNAITGKLTPEDLANACPDLRIIKISAPRFTKGKPGGKWDKVKNSTIEMIYKNGREVDNWTATGCQHTGQGTSSNAYGQAGRNLDLIMKAKDGAVITINDTGEVVKKVNLTETSVPVDYFNIKVNIASSENANNALLQKRFDRYLPYIPGSRVHTPEAKTTMEFYNCVIFVQETGEGGEARVEFSDDQWHFYGIGNIGDSKKTDSSRASDPDDTNEFCVEIMDWNRALSSFPEDTKVKASRYIEKDDSGVIVNYGFLVNENLGKTEDDAEPKLYEKQADGKYVLTQDVEIDLSDLDKYYVDILLNDDFSEDYTYGFRYLNDDEDPEQIAKAKEKWIEFYRFVTRDLTTNGVEDAEKVAQWKSEFSDWFIDDAAFFFYLFTLRYTMVDNRAKNTFWHYGKVATTNEAGELVYATDENGDFIYKFDFWDYDNDTSLGIDNAGKLEMDYGVEDNDKDLAAGNDENSSPTYFRAANSTPFQRIIKYFADVLPTKYAEYESAMSTVFDSESLINEFDAWQSQFPEELWRLDYERKYKRPYVNGSGDNWDNAIAWADKDTRYLTDMMNGKKKYQRRQFERNQDFYMSSKFRGAKNTSDMITLRGAGDLSGANLVIPQNATLHIVPYLNMYVNLSINNTGSFYYTQKCKAGEVVEIPYPSDKFEFNYIYGASRIQNLGDLSPMYLQTATLGRGEKLKEIILGNSTEGYKNNNIKDLSNSISENNKLLTTLNIENLTGVQGSLPVQNIPSVKEIYAKGSKIESVTFARNGLIQKAELPESVSDLRLYDLYYLNELDIEDYNSLLVFAWENTPNIDEQEILKNATNLIRVRAIDIDWTGDRALPNADLLMRLAKCKGIDANNANIDTPILTGKVAVEKIRQSEVNIIKSLWGEDFLEEGYETIPQVALNFYKEYEGENREVLVYTLLKDAGSRLVDSDIPVQDLINDGKLRKEATAQYTFEFDYWRTNEKEYPDGFGTDGISVDIAMNFFGVFKSNIRTYKVSWYTDFKGNVITNASGERAEVEVLYGQSAEYDEAKFGIPKKGVNVNTYYLFQHWDQPTGFIESDMQIYPVWSSAETVPPTDMPSIDYSPAQIFALSQRSLEEGLGKYIADGGQITLDLGYSPDYNGKILIGPGSETYPEAVTFNGTKAAMINTEEKLFNEDKSFVLAIDCTFANKDGIESNCLVSCLSNYQDKGFQISSDNNAAPAVVGVRTSPSSAAISKYAVDGTHREICVIRKIKGNPNLYIYTNDRYSLNEVQETVLATQSQSIVEDTLYFGGFATTTASGSLTQNNFGIGTIHYAKLWYEDLGEEECKRICGWTQDSLTFRRCAVNYYSTPYITNNGTVTEDAPTKMSFVADNLLEETMKFHNADDDYSVGRWAGSDLRKWMNEKLFASISKEWQQVISPVAIKSLYGPKGTGAFQDPESNKEVILTSDKFYLPSVAEVDLDSAKDDTYSLELSKPTVYSIIDTQEERKKVSKNGAVTRWWTRTPEKDASNNDYMKAVDTFGVVTNGWHFEADPDLGSQSRPSQITNGSYYGVLLGFTI